MTVWVDRRCCRCGRTYDVPKMIADLLCHPTCYGPLGRVERPENSRGNDLVPNLLRTYETSGGAST